MGLSISSLREAEVRTGLRFAAASRTKQKENTIKKYEYAFLRCREAIGKLLGQYDAKKPAEFVKANIDKKQKIEVAKKLVSYLSVMHKDLTEFREFAEKWFIYPSKPGNYYRYMEEVMKGIDMLEMYRVYWELIVARKASSIPGFLNRLGERGSFFREFDKNSPFTISIHFKNAFERIKDILNL